MPKIKINDVKVQDNSTVLLPNATIARAEALLRIILTYNAIRTIDPTITKIEIEEN